MAGECGRRMIRLGAHQGCSAITKGLWGIWSCSAFQGCLQLGSSPPRSPHTHRFNCLCFFHYFYCLFPAVRALWPCGKVIATVTAVLAAALVSATSRKWLWGSGNDGQCSPLTTCMILYLFIFLNEYEVFVICKCHRVNGSMRDSTGNRSQLCQ